MKKTTALCLALSLALGTAGTAQADWGRHDGWRDHDSWRHEYRRDYGHRGGWVGPAAVLAITGLALGAAAYSQYQPQPAPVYVAPPPPVVVRPAQESWYYCNSAGQYYPYVQYCPEGWQPVIPQR
ncbi:MAG: hypothetical protein ACM3X0_08405 [Bacteroidota bacterium]